MKYLKSFDTHNDYAAYIESFQFKLLKKDNVSYCKLQKDIHFNKYISDPKLVCKYNVTSTSDPTTLLSSYADNTVFKSMEIDGVQLNELVTEYTFETIGIHTVKYELYDDTQLGNNMPLFLNNNLIDVTIPDSVINIGNVAFVNCYELTNIIIPDSVRSIGNSAFSGLHITNVIIGSGIENINDGVFNNCNNLISITIKATTPPTIYSNTLVSTNNCTFYVPAESVNLYKETNYWYSHRDRIQAIH